MKRKLWTFGLCFGVINVVLILVPFWMGLFTQRDLIHADPRDFLLNEADLQKKTNCTFDTPQKQLITNGFAVYLMGDAAGEKRIRETGRLTGWRMNFLHAGCKKAGPDEISQSVIQFGSVQGAQLNLKQYALSSVYPETWQRLDTTLDLGERALAEKSVGNQQAGSRRVTFAVSFTYRNIGIRIEVKGLEGTVSLQDAIDLAGSVTNKLGSAKLSEGPVPTPTVGIEPLDSTKAIYR